jgi:hypothetical protein
MIPLEAVLKLKESSIVQELQASDLAHDHSPGRDRPMTQEEMDMLSRTRSGIPPWKS